MQEQERTANEEAEKRLKAALTAKRDPVASRVASPSVGPSGGVTESGASHISDAANDNPPLVQDHHANEGSAMEIDATPTAVSPLSAEVRLHPSMKSKSEDVTGLHRRNRGYLSFLSYLIKSRRSHRAMPTILLGISIHHPLPLISDFSVDRAFISRSGSYRRMTSRPPLRSTMKKVLLCGH